MKPSISPLIFAILLAAIAGCSTAQTEIPASAIEVPSTSTSLPPTITLTPADTPAPTATRMVVMEHIIGTWSREDLERGTLFLVFREDGTFDASHGSPQTVVHTGTFTIGNGEITFATGWDCSPLEGDVPGRYSLRQIFDGKYLIFTLIEDACPDRPLALKSFQWGRVAPAP